MSSGIQTCVWVGLCTLRSPSCPWCECMAAGENLESGRQCPVKKKLDHCRKESLIQNKQTT